MPPSRYIVGIDLGTTNCAVAYVDSKGRDTPAADIHIFEVPQLVAAGETAPRPMLPSFLYLPGPHELPPDATSLPWASGADRIVGEFARVQGARVPAHLVSSAKSWLCNANVDREADILPWGAPSDARRVSPVEASADYLRHIRDAWNDTFAHTSTALRLEAQEVVLTVPASFDEAARELTVEAAKRAGLTTVTLLEEPQAAFYCWIVTHQSGWQKEVRAGELILVCDIGGGTTDFSLITVVETPTGPGFRRIAVGDHLMLGGDNMDLTLAHHVEQKLPGIRLDSEQWAALRLACRTAKEKLFSDEQHHDRWPVTIAGRGSRLIGGSLQSELTRDEVRSVVLDGFFPKVGREEEPSRGARAGLQEFGLPYVADAAIPRHIAAFLRRHRAVTSLDSSALDSPDRPARPDCILFNGGALTPQAVRQRIVDVVASWFQDGSDAPSFRPRVLANDSLDLAVAIGAAYFGVVKRGGGIRIGGGTARAFYIGVEADAPHAAGKPWLCVVPRDAQEGDEFEIKDHDFEMLMGQSVAFPLASSSVRANDQPGELVADDPDSILPSPPLVGLMKVGRKARAERVPVRLAARVTEVGTIELWCNSRADDRRWRLQIQLRGPEGSAVASTSADVTGTQVDAVVLEHALIERASEAIRTAFAAPAQSESGPSRLVKRLEELFAIPKAEWPPSALRALWEPLRDVAEARARSPQHEERWLNLAGYCLRPGTGYPLDESRIKALWPLWSQGPKHPRNTQSWVEWWVLWRRVAAGLNRAHHEEIHRRLIAYLLPSSASSSAKKASRPKPEAHELSEMWRAVASLERIKPAAKEPLGNALVNSLNRGSAGPHTLWSIGRLGARVPLYAPANVVVHPGTAAKWLEVLLKYPPRSNRETTDLMFALTQIARVSGDRARDLPPDLRASVLDRLSALGADESATAPVREYHDLASAQQGFALGDALPVGLRLLRSSGDTPDE